MLPFVPTGTGVGRDLMHFTNCQKWVHKHSGTKGSMFKESRS